MPLLWQYTLVQQPLVLFVYQRALYHWAVLAVAFSPNGKIIVSGGQDKTIKVWKFD
ncbi:WD40 repeat domain-containing protein [Nodularia sp. UHCC 0506]|uniref:WD40 repeat domain-containing protein n=1 Tax=Nodularia sp. UHCC 0506 TaxID=3110243 RepID=UPI002B1F83EB|nr:WD40 repeat domain-containing protein [Nodularia sp. UHCC 0506]MEA5515319.1 WD40 repeat domain-containing protein [Nodularia sp. UHCC 0506]